MCACWKAVVGADTGGSTLPDEIDAQQNDADMEADDTLLNTHIYGAMNLLHPDSTVKFYFSTEFYWYCKIVIITPNKDSETSPGDV